MAQSPSLKMHGLLSKMRLFEEIAKTAESMSPKWMAALWIVLVASTILQEYAKS